MSLTELRHVQGSWLVSATEPWERGYDHVSCARGLAFTVLDMISPVLNSRLDASLSNHFNFLINHLSQKAPLTRRARQFVLLFYNSRPA